MSKHWTLMAAALLLACPFAEAAPLDVEGDQFTLWVTADPQVGPADTMNPNLRGPNNVLRNFVEAANEARPDGVLFVGDLTFAGDAPSMENFAATISELAVPSVLIKGRSERGAAYDRVLGSLEDGADGFVDLSLGDWRIIGIPSPQPANSADAHTKNIDRVRSALRKQRSRPTIVLHHDPLLPVGMTSLEADALPADYRRRLVEVLTDARQVKYVLVGNAHPGVMASVRGSLTYKDKHFVLIPTLLNPRSFGDEYKAFRPDVKNLNHGYYLTLAFEDDSVLINGAKVGTEFTTAYPEAFREFDDSKDPRAMLAGRDVPATDQVVNGGFEDPLSVGWLATHRYKPENDRGPRLQRDRDRHSEGRYGARLRLYLNGSAWTRDEYVELYQAINAKAFNRPRVKADYMATGTGRSHFGGGYFRITLYGADDRPRSLIFHWGARESRTVYLQQAFSTQDTGEAQPRKWRQEQDERGYVLSWEIPDGQGIWHPLDVDVAEVYDAYHGEGAYSALRVERLMIGFGVWLGAERRATAEGLVDNVRITESDGSPSSVGRRNLALTDRHRGSPYGVWERDR